jgi:hypothetical protein
MMWSLLLYIYIQTDTTMSKKHNKKPISQYPIDERSTRKTFDAWFRKNFK